MSERSLKEVAKTWETLAQIDPLWAVLSDPDKRDRRWDVEEFLQTGEAEIGELFAELRHHGLQRTETALGFGCGVGRLSIPLSHRFERVVSVDISPSMVENAKRLSAGRSNIEFVVNARNDLTFLPSESQDLVYSNIVLQHMDPHLAAEYIREFFRVCRPQGFVVFQIPSHLTDEWLPGGNDGTRLSDGAHRCSIEFEVAGKAHPRQKLQVIARVRNDSPIEWQQDLTNQINLGNHWLDEVGTEVLHDDGRARLPSRLAPGEQCEVRLDVTAPEQPGPFILELDIVQEGVTWFSDRGAQTARRSVIVEESPQSDGAETAQSMHALEYPTFMMQGIPRAEVESIIAACDARVLAVHPHETEWISYRYITRRND